MPELAEGSRYCMRVRLVDASGHESEPAELCAEAVTCSVVDCAADGWGPECAPWTEDEAGDDPADESDASEGGGCAAGGQPGAAGLAALAVALLFTRRRRAGGAR